MTAESFLNRKLEGLILVYNLTYGLYMPIQSQQTLQAIHFVPGFKVKSTKYDLIDTD